MNADYLRRLDFGSVQGDSESWERARLGDDAILLQTAESEFVVNLADGASSHVCEIEERADGYWGRCDCDAFSYGHHECAHLCALRKADFIGAIDVEGERITIPTTGTADERRARADGGRRDDRVDDVENPGAGHDGRVFGRPEGRL
ncbi:hypothetical protein [Halarchaeum salinum]|uniref:SWIM-type domain-containing protein n=1 Tax=Halarchaeum salinum TaxID=489912 RepID=A0AAV3S7V8_9EURY